ncbi:MAG: hypothetical protein ACQETV_00190 [Actinomycetota bacterium]
MSTVFRPRDPSAGGPWPLLAVIGAADAEGALIEAAEAVGRAAAARGHGIVCGGRGGVMAAACRGARAGGAPTVGLLPGSRPGSRARPRAGPPASRPPRAPRTPWPARSAGTRSRREVDDARRGTYNLRS